VAAREGLRLAFVAALQLLPPRQRAILVLREVLQWPAADVAVALGSSVDAVNSGLQRARARLSAAAPAQHDLAEPSEQTSRDLLDRYVRAFVNADVDGLARLLTDDVILQMPQS